MWAEFIYKSIKTVVHYFCFPDRPIKGGDILDFQIGGNLRKGGGVDLEKGRVAPLTNYAATIYVNVKITEQN